MQIYRLRDEEKKYFDWMDPYGFLNRLALPHYFALASCVKGEDKGDIPSGLLVGSIEDDRIIIEWMCVAPEMREQGIGEALLDKVFEIAAKQGFTQVAAGFIDDPDLKNAEEMAAEYFREQNFMDEEERPGEWNILVEQLSTVPYFKEDRNNLPAAKTLRDLTPDQVKNAINTLGPSDQASRLFDPAKCRADFDPKLSTVLMADDDPCGLLLVIRAGNICYPVFMYSESEREKKSLILTAAEAVLRELPPDGMICLIAADDETAELAETLFPGEKVESVMLLADVEQ